MSSPELKVFQYRKADDFRPIQNLNMDVTPLALNISAWQTILTIPGCIISLAWSFPRVSDGAVAPNCTMVGLAMDDVGAPIRFNGVEREQPLVIVGNSGASFTAVERSGRRLASIVFSPEVADRGWPNPRTVFELFETTREAHHGLQHLIARIFDPETFADPLTLRASSSLIKESLLAALDNVFAHHVQSKWAARANSATQYRIFQDVQAVISSDLGRPIYSAELANQIGVSVRTVQNAVRRYRGMSLHQYLRLRRLWLVRQRLLRGGTSVKDVALALGFWHLGDFSTSYRSLFGETPSETLARSR
jgi:AraC-like DNA-binding protein